MMTAKRTKRAALWATLLMLAASLCGGCLIAAAGDGATGGLSTTELVTVVDAQAAFSSEAGGVTVTGNGNAYSGQLNGVFTGDVTLRMDFLGDEAGKWVTGDGFTWTFTDVTDPENSFSIEYVNTVTWDGIGYTIGHVYYKDQVRTAEHDDTKWYDQYKGGEHAMCAPQFPGGYGKHDPADLQLHWDEEGILHVTAYRHDCVSSRDIAAFDGTETFEDKVSWGLPKLTFPQGYTITFTSSETAPDICFQTITDDTEEFTLNTETLETAPGFYTEWKTAIYDPWYAEWSAKPGIANERIVQATTGITSGYITGYNGIGATGITVNRGEGGDSNDVPAYTGALGQFTGDTEIAFMFVQPNTNGPTYANFDFIVGDSSGEEVFRISYISSHGYYTQAGVRMGDEIRSQSSDGAYTGDTQWYSESTIYYQMPIEQQQFVRPGMGAGNAGVGTLKFAWNDDILSVYAQGRNKEDIIIAKFDGSAKPTDEQIGSDGYMTVADGATWGLPKVFDQLKDGYTISFFCAEKCNLPVTFVSVDGVRLGVLDQIKMSEESVSAQYSFDLVEDEGNYYVMQNDGDFDMTTTTTYGLTDGWTIEDSVTAPYAGSDIDVMTPDTYTVGGATVVVEPAYTVTYETAGGGEYPAQTFSAHYKEAVILPADPTKAGYTFDGWRNGQTAWTGTSEEVAALSGNTTITAAWTAEEYDITYNANGGTGAEDGTYTIESETITLPTPTKTGYTFGGWFENATFAGSAVTEIAAGTTGDKTFYAKWTAVEYDITYNANGGTGAENDTYTIEDAVTLPVPVRDGYTFGGWFENETFAGSAVTEIAAGTVGDKTFYAKWTENATDEPGEPDDEPGDDPNDPAGPTDPGDSGDGEADGGCGCGGVLAASSAIPAALALAAGGALLFRRKRSGDDKRQ